MTRAKAAPARRRRAPARRRRRFGWPRRGAIHWTALGIAAVLAAPQIGDYAMSLRPVAGCRVTQVIDGDTVQLVCPGTETARARLYGFDAPEVFSPQCASEAFAGMLATQKLRSLVWGADEIEALYRGYDRYGRRLAELSVDGTSVAQLMVASGHARPYGGERREGWCG